jgi:chromosome segregation ATPase
MTYEPVAQRIERIRDRLAEIDAELASLQVEADTDTEEPAEQAELLSRVTELRDEQRVLSERLEGLRDEPGSPPSDQTRLL